MTAAERVRRDRLYAVKQMIEWLPKVRGSDDFDRMICRRMVALAKASLKQEQLAARRARLAAVAKANKWGP